MKYVLLLVVLLLSGCAHGKMTLVANTVIDDVNVEMRYELK